MPHGTTASHISHLHADLCAHTSLSKVVVEGVRTRLMRFSCVGVEHAKERRRRSSGISCGVNQATPGQLLKRLTVEQRLVSGSGAGTRLSSVRSHLKGFEPPDAARLHRPASCVVSPSVRGAGAWSSSPSGRRIAPPSCPRARGGSLPRSTRRSRRHRSSGGSGAPYAANAGGRRAPTRRQTF